jgi:hypothetical protein
MYFMFHKSKCNLTIKFGIELDLNFSSEVHFLKHFSFNIEYF